MGDNPEELIQEAEEKEGGPIKTFLEHLEDLRWTIIKSGAALVVCMVVCLVGSPQIVKILTWPMHTAEVPIKLELFGPVGGFMISIKLAFYAGLVLGLPIILFFIAQYVVPALKHREKQFLGRAFTIGTGFFLLGVVVCFFYIAPLSMRGLYQFNLWLGFDSSIWRAEDYFEFITKFMLGVGLLFEVPVVLLSLVRFGILSHATLAKGRRFMFVANFALCAVLTPADMVTTFVMTLIMQLAYEICLLISRHWEKQRLAQEAAGTK